MVTSFEATRRSGREHGLKVFVDGDRCFPYFHQNHGCSVCIAVCPFTRRPYRRLKERFERREGALSEDDEGLNLRQ